MPKNKKLLKTIIFLFNSILILGIIGCASMQRPMGGPIDKTPPKVLKMEPENLSTNFTAEKIVITFDEYFNINNEATEFSISPEQETAPILKKNKKSLEVIFQDTLEKNTTYVLNFGNAIADVNESNIAKNLTYAFSTGDKLDSLEISGHVFDLNTGDSVLNATVFIFPLAQDTLLGKKRPPIFTNTDSSGNFNLKHLKEGVYKIYAIKEEQAGDKIYQQRTDQIAFYKDSINLKKNVSNIVMGLFKEDPEITSTLDYNLQEDGIFFAKFNKTINNPSLEILNNEELDKSKIVKYGINKDSVKVWFKDYNFDSLEIVFKENQIAFDTVKINKDKDTKFNQTVTITDNHVNTQINPYKGFNLYFNYPIKEIDLKKVKLLQDTTRLEGITIENSTADPFTYQVKYPWKKSANYTLMIEENAITSVYNSKNKLYRRNFTLGNTDDYGSYVLKMKIPDTSSYYILEILNDKKKIIKSDLIKKDTTISLTNFPTETYTMRIIYDENKNGKWDTGSVKMKTLPEQIWINNQEFMIRANWDQQITYNIPENPKNKKAEPQKKETESEKKETKTAEKETAADKKEIIPIKP